MVAPVGWRQRGGQSGVCGEDWQQLQRGLAGVTTVVEWCLDQGFSTKLKPKRKFLFIHK